jgi:hypothetical protein
LDLETFFDCCGDYWEFLGIPPILLRLRQLDKVKCHYEFVFGKSAIQDFNTVRRVFFCCQINCKASTNTSPARFFSSPLQPTAGPGKLFSVKQPTTRTDNPIAKVTTRTVKDLS